MNSKNTACVSWALVEAIGYDIIAELPAFSVFDKGKVKDMDDTMLKAQKTGLDLAQSLTG